MITTLRQLLIALIILCTSVQVVAQTQTLEGFANFKKRSLTPIYAGNEVKGYIMFYKADKADKRNDNYGLDFFDQELRKVKSVMLPKTRYSYQLLRSTFNGEAFSFYFYNYRAKTLEVDVFDKSLNKLASKQFDKLSKADMSIALQETQLPNDGENKPIGGLNMYPVPNKGFIRNTYTGMMKGFALEMYDNKMNSKWVFQTDKKSKDYESVVINEITDKHIFATIVRKPNMLSKQMTFSVAAFDTESGKKIMDIPVEKEGAAEQLSLTSLNYDAQTDELLTIGEFYKLEDKPFINKSQGFYIKRFSVDGLEKSAKFYTWASDVNPYLPAAAKESLDKGFVNFVHRMVKGADGKMHIVAEQYRIAADGMGIAMAVLGGGTSTAKGIIGNMMILTINPDQGLQKVTYFEKDETNCTLPPGSGFYGAGLLGQVIKMTGGFDYQFTQQNNDHLNFNTAYINYKKVKKSKYMDRTLVNIQYTGEPEFLTDEIDLTADKESYSYVYPAKPGYVLVLDNQHQDKKLDLKLVKLNR